MFAATTPLPDMELVTPPASKSLHNRDIGKQKKKISNPFLGNGAVINPFMNFGQSAGKFARKYSSTESTSSTSTLFDDSNPFSQNHNKPSHSETPKSDPEKDPGSGVKKKPIPPPPPRRINSVLTSASSNGHGNDPLSSENDHIKLATEVVTMNGSAEAVLDKVEDDNKDKCDPDDAELTHAGEGEDGKMVDSSLSKAEPATIAGAGADTTSVEDPLQTQDQDEAGVTETDGSVVTDQEPDLVTPQLMNHSRDHVDSEIDTCPGPEFVIAPGYVDQEVILNHGYVSPQFAISPGHVNAEIDTCPDHVDSSRVRVSPAPGGQQVPELWKFLLNVPGSGQYGDTGEAAGGDTREAEAREGGTSKQPRGLLSSLKRRLSSLARRPSTSRARPRQTSEPGGGRGEAEADLSPLYRTAALRRQHQRQHQRWSFAGPSLGSWQLETSCTSHHQLEASRYQQLDTSYTSYQQLDSTVTTQQCGGLIPSPGGWHVTSGHM